jgi:hypothetical protein
MTIREDRTGSQLMPEVSGRFVSADVIKLFQERITGSCRGLEDVYLRGIRKSSALGGIANRVGRKIGLIGDGRKVDIVTVTPRGTGGL